MKCLRQYKNAWEKSSVSVLQQQLISNMKDLNDLTELIPFEEIVNESIKGVKDAITKIIGRIELSDGLIERPRVQKTLL